MAIEVGIELKKAVSYHQLKRFIKEKLNYSWRRLRKWLKPKQDPVEYQRLFEWLQKLKKLEESGFLDLFYGDQSSFCMNPNVPYGWQEKGNSIKIVPSKETPINSNYAKKSCIIARPKKSGHEKMEYSVISKKSSQFIALTSLQVEEFEWLLKDFSPICEKYFRYHTLEGKNRKIITSKEHGNAKLQGSEQKLFFLLVYLKTNSLQEHQAASFGISQTKVSRISHVLLSLLNETLQKMKLMPYRDGELLAKQLENHPTKVFIYDGMERGILRNALDDAQEDEYSGKKKRIR